MDEPVLRESSWAAMTWEGAHLNTLVDGARMSLAEKVAWLESAHYAVERLREQWLRRRAEAGKGRAT